MEPEHEARIAADNAAEVRRAEQSRPQRPGFFGRLMEWLEGIAVIGDAIQLVVLVVRGIWIALKALFALLRVFD
ncbi:hypothetical protein EOD42_11335 [Rhodovarius crocodyli]|uniref:Uncharacterized protein n=1 Tax=Rhodovarius crocodyli TaxID=1979269 RepID=A0A437MH40_9PROT|nr:hypothetical protein [Rhodovarius crocodyli]RVT96980.1 hypothetical protein EOD42_11335 [Rhodovarius crocodyli]